MARVFLLSFIVFMSVGAHAEALFTCSDGSIQVDLFQNQGQTYLRILNQRGAFFSQSLNRRSLRSFDGLMEKEGWVYLSYDKGTLFMKVFSKTYGDSRLTEIKCGSASSLRPLFCESYEDFEECREDVPVGPDGPYDGI